MARIPKGWNYNSTDSKYQYSVYNSANSVKPVFDEDGSLYQGGTKVTATAAQLNTTKIESQSVLFTEAGAGTYTGTVALPAGAVVVDIIVHAIALWAAATSASMIVGDTVDDNGFFDAIDLKATDLLAAESISFAQTEEKREPIWTILRLAHTFADAISLLLETLLAKLFLLVLVRQGVHL